MTFPLYLKSRPMQSLRTLMVLGCGVSFSYMAHAADQQPAARAVATVEAQSNSNAQPNDVADGSTLTAKKLETASPQYVEQGRRIDIGAATGDLLTMQRKSAGTHPRPIDGEQARRSYQRYLKSFETSIPDRFDTGLDLKKQ